MFREVIAIAVGSLIYSAHAKAQMSQDFQANIVGGSAVTDRTSPAYLHTVRFFNTGTVATDGVPSEYAGKKWGWRCSGTIIAPRIVITAAHCFPEGFFIDDPQKPGTPKMVPFASVKGEVFFKLNSREDKIFGAKVVKYIRHSAFSDSWMYTFPEIWNPTNSVNDITLALLDSPVPAEKLPAPVVDPTSVLNTGTPLVLAGYGRSGNATDSDLPTLRQTTAPFNKRLKNNTDAFVGEGDMDTPAGVKDPHGACQGDSGGPAYLIEGNKAKLAGIIVRGPDEQNGGCLSSVTIITDLRAFGTWIRENTQRLLKE